ncbi:alpha/beta hydrolase [Corynebacterium sp. ES2794-CONJ1]|uniref:alpha/beta hydrolase n=1 Tax=unclassified Corynebacterium TaxID=2624378 RepID=UPI002168F252|nr:MULTISPECIES: alpha/beta hydrolase [unclassified Corynebacterium]MCS4489108.1 alpha/beta hydrolase [Corynebacterium sp. ES2775-CONJ]MCS4490921.1 alpha/beta hydrolase [Corynebacterium sp. ES2715-CONJ3]MCS4531197.1 alpha/beta hydrolase [Corynebacterium sp. ES2730-CONJ]MCU9518565.1 alpha/beta hydrolase [Corynebacterium sp. ES2794-CONJ1]
MKSPTHSERSYSPDLPRKKVPPAPPTWDTAQWEDDILGSEFRQLTFDLGSDPDEEGRVSTTLIRHQSHRTEPAQTAVLYIHGMTDYFFQTHLAEHFSHNSFDFFALDLRKCGRSRQAGQTWHYTSHMDHYYPDLSTAVDFLSSKYDSIVLIGHSTGGLVVVDWLDHIRRTNPTLHSVVTAAILNSPWFDVPLPKALYPFAYLLIGTVGYFKPFTPFTLGNLGTYGESVHKDYSGEWDFDTRMKPIGGCQKYFGWMRAVMRAQLKLRRRTINTGVPVLTLCSSRSHTSMVIDDYSHRSDTVLDVDQIKQWAPFVSSHSTIVEIEDGMHDLYLSPRPVRDRALQASTTWLQHLQ